MRHSILACVLLIPLMLRAQAPKPIEPEYVGTIAYLNPSLHELVKLEVQTPALTARTKLMGYGGATAAWVYKGARSPTRILPLEKPSFILRLDPGGRDPASLITFQALTLAKGNRELIVSKSGILAQKTRTSTEDSAIRFEVQKYGTGSVKITPLEPLLPGEYVLSSAASPQAYCFGVDAPGR